MRFPDEARRAYLKGTTYGERTMDGGQGSAHPWTVSQSARSRTQVRSAEEPCQRFSLDQLPRLVEVIIDDGGWVDSEAVINRGE